MEKEPQETNYLLEAVQPEQCAEYMRMTLAKLSEHKLPMNPVFYSLFFIYVSGKNLSLNNKVDKYLKNNELSHDAAVKLFVHYFFICSEELAEGLRNELVDTITEAISALIEVAGKSSMSNKQLEKHIDTLAGSQSTHNILSVVSSIIHITRQFVADTKKLESDLVITSKGLNVLKNELTHARMEATTDSLTGLLNRRGFENQIKKILNDRRRNGTNFSIVIVDIDHFKDINDKYGHLFGDKILKVFAKMLQEKTRSTDYTARFGGEEFILLLPETALDNAYNVSEHIRTSIEKLQVRHTKTGEVVKSLTASFGVACHRFDEPLESLLDRCDQAMYKAKETGRNQTVKST